MTTDVNFFTFPMKFLSKFVSNHSRIKKIECNYNNNKDEIKESSVHFWSKYFKFPYDYNVKIDTIRSSTPCDAPG